MELRGWMAGVALAMVSSIVACGDGDTGGDGGSGGQGTGGGGASGPPKGAWSLFFEDGPTCKPGAENQAVGTVSASSLTELLTDGESGASIACTVAKTASGFEVSASASKTSRSFSFVIGSLPATATEGSPATGTASFTSPNTAATFSAADCVFYFLPQTPQGVEEGEVFLTFECPTIAAAPDNVCRIPIGYAAFEGCSTKAD